MGGWNGHNSCVCSCVCAGGVVCRDLGMKEKRIQPITNPVTGHISIKDPQLFPRFSDNGPTNCQ